jgi:hypothetical protein
MSRACSFVAFAACLLLLCACDDGVLHAFEPHAVDGLGGTGSSVEGGGGRGGMAAVNPAAGAGLAPPTSPLLIDDFEDGDMRAKSPLGWWYPINDSTGTQGTGIEPLAGGTGSVYALRTHGSGFTKWGAAVGLDLTGESTSLNALGYQKLCFVARVAAGSSSSIQVHLLRDPGVHYQREASVSEVWSRYCLPLADFIGADQEVLVPDELTALQFFFTPEAPFELWLDDIQIEP